MVGRVILSATVICAVLLVPVLCLGGVANHACECALESACSHESGCTSDPCVQVVVQRKDGLQTVPDPASPSPTLIEVVCQHLPGDALDLTLTGQQALPQPERYCDSSLPLLN